jgi:hypothetical protein
MPEAFVQHRPPQASMKTRTAPTLEPRGDELVDAFQNTVFFNQLRCVLRWRLARFSNGGSGRAQLDQPFRRNPSALGLPPIHEFGGSCDRSRC